MVELVVTELTPMCFNRRFSVAGLDPKEPQGTEVWVPAELLNTQPLASVLGPLYLRFNGAEPGQLSIRVKGGAT